MNSMKIKTLHFRLPNGLVTLENLKCLQTGVNVHKHTNIMCTVVASTPCYFCILLEKQNMPSMHGFTFLRNGQTLFLVFSSSHKESFKSTSLLLVLARGHHPSRATPVARCFPFASSATDYCARTRLVP